jgi:hypothetical protein
MANDKLCFVLGAGASAHFGYPLGAELVEAMHIFVNKLINNSANAAISVSQREDLNNAANFIQDIKSYNPLNIDYFLYNHPQQEALGKKLIESVLLRCQNRELFGSVSKVKKWWNPSEEIPYGNWIKFIHHRIVANCETVDDVKNQLENIDIITFNYDLSFEQALWNYFITSRFNDKSEELKNYLFTKFYQKNIIHVYGSVSKGEQPYICSTPRDIKDMLDIYDKSTGSEIDVIGIHKSIDSNDCEECKKNTSGNSQCKRCMKIEYCRDVLKAANKVYFLGYAFDEFNNKVLKLKDVFIDNANKENQKLVFYTNYSDGLICDSSVRGFFDHKHIETLQYDSRITKVFQDKSYTDPRHWLALITKSSKSVYESLEKDLNIPISYQYK